MSKRYAKSEQLLERAEKSIPLGSQTFSKSKTQYPFGVSPYFIEKGRGGHCWDADGNEYLDLVMGLASVTLGYNDPDVMAAVSRQLEIGTIFSLPHRLEIEVAEEIVDLVPCAEKVRFGKNGSDATAGAVRLARAYTGRDKVVVCGYHGWQDWYIGSTARNKGVPKAVRELTLSFPYNDIAAARTLFENNAGEIAAVILEPMNRTEPQPGFLASLKELAHENGALFVLDETITGFRLEIGGAQERFDVVPDLATFGKGLANGYPLAAIAGRADVMDVMEDIFFSSTFGGELLSLAAAKAVMGKLRREPVIASLKERGGILKQGLASVIEAHGAGQVFSLGGDVTWPFLNFHDCQPYSQWQIKTLFLQECFARGVLVLGSHNLCYAHGQDDISRLLEVYHEVIGLVAKAVREETLPGKLQCQPLEPLFKIR